MMTLEKELKKYLTDDVIKNLSDDKKKQLEVWLELANLLTKEEQDDLKRAMEEIERRKLTLYDELCT